MIVRPSRVPLPDEREQFAGRSLVDARERLVEQDQGRVLKQQPREKDALELAGRKGADHARFETRQPDGRQRRAQRPAMARAGRTEGSDPSPQAGEDDIRDGDGKPAIDLRDLREPGGLAQRRMALHRAARERDFAHDRLQETGLSGAVRAGDGGQRAGREGARQALDRRPPAIGGGDVTQGQGVGAGHGSAFAQAIACHRSAPRTDAASRRCHAAWASRDDCGSRAAPHDVTI